MVDPQVDWHRWFRARIDAHALGLLDEAEEQRFLGHAEACSSCRDAMKAQAGPPPRSGDHIPAGILARWDRASASLRGVPRRMVREHLMSCAECRQDLEAIGFVAVLDKVPELEGPEDDATDALPPTLPVGQHEIRLLPLTTRPRQWIPWLVGAGAGAALATASTLLIVANVRPPEMRPGVPGGPVATSREGPRESGFLLEVLPPAGALPGQTRSMGEGQTTIRIGAETRFIHLTLPDLHLPDTSTVAIEVFGPGGARLLRATRLYQELFHRRTLLIGSPGHALDPGTYRLRITAPHATESPPTELTLILVR